MHNVTGASYNIATGSLAGVSKLTLVGLEVADEVLTVGAGDTIRIVDARDATAGTNFLDIAAAATVTALNFEIANSGTSATAEIVLDIEATGVTTVTVTEDGTLSKSFTSITTATGTHEITTVNIISTGKGVDFATIDDATVINASGSTASVALDTAVNKVAITGGSAADDVTLDHAASVAFEGTINLGDGDDKLTITSLNDAADLVDNKVTLNGGAGSDTLVMINALADALTDLTAANFAKKGITGFEKLVVSDVTTAEALDFTILGISDVTLAAGQGDNATFTFANASTLTLGSAASATNDTATIVVKGAADAGSSSDVFTLNLNATHAGSNILYGELSIANVETLNIVSSSQKTTVPTEDNDIDIAAANATKIVVTGNTGLLLTGDAFDGVVTSFDASGLSANISVSFAGGAGVTYIAADGPNTVTGSSNADLINGSAKGDTIEGGAGIDVINLGAAGAVDTVVLTVTATANRDTINNFDVAGTFKDIIQVAATATAVATNATDAPVQQVVSSTASAHTVADVDFIEFSFEGAVALAGVTDGSALLKAISNTSSDAALTVDAEGDELYAIAYQGGSAFIYYIQDETANDSDSAAIQADEIFLVATITNVEVGSLTMANFDLI